MKKLTEREVIEIMREEWNARLNSLTEKKPAEKSEKKPDTDLSVEVPLAGEKQVVISPGLKVKSKNGKKNVGGGLLYTVKNVDKGTRKVTLQHDKESGPVLRTLSWEEFNKEFERQ
jgi:hypothetical protein